MRGVSLTPMAGAQGEFAGVAMIRAYHRARGDLARTEIIVPDAAHGTNPATATMCGCTVREIPSLPNGDIDLDALKRRCRPADRRHHADQPVARSACSSGASTRSRGIVHEAGGLLYYDGANLNAILGKVRPGDMGFDVIHMNLHKTFSTPHGGGGPGSGAVGVERAPAAVPADSDRRQGKATVTAGSTRRDLPQIDRPAVGLHGQRRRAAARLRLHAHARPRRHAARGGVRDAQRQLPHGAAARRPVSSSRIPSAAPATSSSSRCSARRGSSASTRWISRSGCSTTASTRRRPISRCWCPECLLIEPTETESKEELDALRRGA